MSSEIKGVTTEAMIDLHRANKVQVFIGAALESTMFSGISNTA